MGQLLPIIGRRAVSGASVPLRSAAFAIELLQALTDGPVMPSEPDPDKFTLSLWVRRCLPEQAGTDGMQCWVSHDAGGGGGRLETDNNPASPGVQTRDSRSGNSVYSVEYHDTNFFDPTRWWHVVLVGESDQPGTTADRLKLYIDNVEQASSNVPEGVQNGENFGWSHSASNHALGWSVERAARWMDGGLYDVIFVSGEALTPGDFAEDVAGQWRPKAPPAIAVGYRCDFVDDTDMGKDVTGHTGGFVNTNGVSQRLDTPLDTYPQLHTAPPTPVHGPVIDNSDVYRTGLRWSRTGDAVQTAQFATHMCWGGRWYYEATRVGADAPVLLGWGGANWPNDTRVREGTCFYDVLSGGVTIDGQVVETINTTGDGQTVGIGIDFPAGEFVVVTPDDVEHRYAWPLAYARCYPAMAALPVATQAITIDFNFGQLPAGFSRTVPSGFQSISTAKLPAFVPFTKLWEDGDTHVWEDGTKRVFEDG